MSSLTLLQKGEKKKKDIRAAHFRTFPITSSPNSNFSEAQTKPAVRTQLVADKLSPKWPNGLHNTSCHKETEPNNACCAKCGTDSKRKAFNKD